MRAFVMAHHEEEGGAVNENKTPGDRLLELVVFGPTGLAVSLVEEFPKFVEKGRHRVEGQVHTARLVGQFAVQMGRRQVEQSLAYFGGQHDRPAPHADVVDDDEHARGGEARHERRPDAPAAFAPTTTVAGPGPTAELGGQSAQSPWRPSVWQGAGGPNGSDSPTSLAIPGYDSLSASQVVQRLEGLSSVELEEVRVHEAAHRQRRTILHRVEQLLAGSDDAAP